MPATSTLRFAANMVAALLLLLISASPVTAQQYEESFAGPNYARPESWTAFNAPDKDHWYLRDGSFVSGDGRQVQGGYSYAVLDASQLGGASDYTVSTNVSLMISSGRALLVGRWSDPQTHYEAAYDIADGGAAKVTLDRVSRGRRTTLAVYDRNDLPTLVGVGNAVPAPTFAMTLQGDQVSVSVNGRSIIDVTDSLPLRTGSAGIGQFRTVARFTSFSVSAPVAATTPSLGGGGESSDYYIVVNEGLRQDDLAMWKGDFDDAGITNALIVPKGDSLMLVLGPYSSPDQALMQHSALLDEGFVLNDVVSGLPAPARPLAEAVSGGGGAAPAPTPSTVASGNQSPQGGGGPFGGGGGGFGNNNQQPTPAAGGGGSEEAEVIQFIAVRVATHASFDQAKTQEARLEADGYFPVLTLREDEGHNVYVGRFDDATQNRAEMLLADMQRAGLNPAGLYRVSVRFTPEMVRRELERNPNFAGLDDREQDEIVEVFRKAREQEYREQTQNRQALQELERQAAELNERQREFLGSYQTTLKSMEDQLAQMAQERARESANRNRISNLRVPFLQALNDRNYTEAERLLREAEGIDPKDSQTLRMRDSLEEKREAEADLQVAEEALQHLIRRAREEESNEDWDAAQGLWNDVLSFQPADVVKPAVIEQAEKGVRRAKTEREAIKLREDKQNKWFTSMIWGTVLVIGVLAVWFFYYHVTTRRRVVKIMEETLPEMALPALDLGGDASIPQLESRQATLALPEGSGDSTGGGGSVAGGTPPRPSGNRLGKSRQPTSGGAAAANAPTKSKSHLAPSGGAPSGATPPNMPSSPSGSGERRAPTGGGSGATTAAPNRPGARDPKTVVLPPDQQQASADLSAPTKTPAPGGEKKDDKKPGINLGGLPDMPAFDGISGGAKPPASPAAAPGTSGPAFDIHNQPTRMDFQALSEDKQAAPSAPVNANPMTPAASPLPPAAESPSGVGSLLDGLPQSDSFGATPSPDGKPAAAPAGAAGANGVLYSQDFAGVSGSPVPGWEGSFDFATLDVVPASQYGNGANAPGNCLRYEKKTGSGQVYYYCTFPNAKGSVTVEFDVCCVEKNRYLLGLYLEKDKDFRRSIHTVIACSSPRAKASLRIQGTPAAYEMGAWAHVKFDLDMHRNTLTAEVNGETIIENEAVENMPDAINTIAIRDNHPTTGTLLMSNLKVSQKPKDD